MGRLDGEVAVVTGAARGIGRATAELFVREGADVIGADVREPKGHAGESDDRSVLYRTTDISDERAVVGLVDFAVERFGRLDVLANVAAVQVEHDVTETTSAEFDWMVATNLRGTFLCCKYAIGAMRKSGGGVIVNIGSISGMFGDPGIAVYATTKGGVHALTRAITIDHGRHGIRCNAILPGWIRTELTDQYLSQLPDPAAAEARAAKHHPVGRIGRPEDVANAALWLASDESAFVAGQLIGVDGGISARSAYPYD